MLLELRLRLDSISTMPVPFGSRTMFPLTSVELSVFPSARKLSTSNCVRPDNAPASVKIPTEFCTRLPVVPSNFTNASSVAVPGPVTLPSIN